MTRLLLTILIGACFLSGYAQELRGQLMLDPNNPTKLVINEDRNGDGQLDPFFLCGPGDPEGFLYRGNRNPDGTRNGDQLQLIRKLKQYGGNSIYVMAVRTHGGDAWKDKRDDPENYPDDLHNPWIDQNPKKGLNEKILDQWETWFAEMDKHGIVIYFFVYDDAINVANQFGWPLDEKGNLHPEHKKFIQDLVRRFKHHKHLIWCVMEEGQEIGKDWRVHVSKIAEAIHEADDHRHIIASHQHGGNVFYHKDDPIIKQFALQTDKDKVQKTHDLYLWMLEARRNSDAAYSIVMSEDFVHGNISVPNNDREEMRQRCWAAAMADAYLMVFGMDIANTPKEWLNDLKIMKGFFEKTNFNQMYPDETQADAEIKYVLTNSGFDYIVYSPKAGNDLGIKHLNEGRYTFTWFDCVSGKRKVFQSAVSGNTHVWKKPSGFGQEVALYIERMDKRPDPKYRHVTKRSQEIVSGRTNTAPVAESTEIKLSGKSEVSVQLRYSDADGGPGPYTIEIISGPEHGELNGVGNDRIYVPGRRFSGKDQFTWKIHDGETSSNTAIITIVGE